MKTLSIDIGAGSGRFIVVDYSPNNGFLIEEIYRFTNGMTAKDSHLYWDIKNLMREIIIGLQKSFAMHKDIASIGVDTWGCDYVLFSNEIPDLTLAYRDERCAKAQEQLLNKVSYNLIYKETGIQNLPFNTIFQFYDDELCSRQFSHCLMIPDFINYCLTGKMYLEITNFSTTALYNPKTKATSSVLLDYLDLPFKFSRLIAPSKVIGELSVELQKQYNLPSVPVISVASHDTASAVAAMKLTPETMFLSSGSWSLLGVELPEPLINKKSYAANFTNEVGVEDRICFLKNVGGLFVIQELVKDYNLTHKHHITYAEIERKVQKKALNIDFFIDLNDALLQTPGHMMQKIKKYFKKTRQVKPRSFISLMQGIYFSLVLAYAQEKKTLEAIVGTKFKRLVVVGGGSKSAFLNQLISDVLDVEVETGSSEATALGNAIAQFIGLKVFKNLDEAREAIKLTSTIYHRQKNYEKEIEKYRIWKGENLCNKK